MEDNFEKQIVISYVKNIMNNRRIADTGIHHLCSFIDSILSTLDLTTKHNKQVETIEELVGWGEKKIRSRKKIAATRTAILEILEAHEAKNKTPKIGSFAARISELSLELGLNQGEADVLGFLIRYQYHDPFNQLTNELSGSGVAVDELCTTCLGIDKNKMHNLFDRKGRLLVSGIVVSPVSSSKYLSDCFFVPDLILTAIRRALTCQESVLQLLLGPTAEASLDWEDFDHIAGSRDRLLPFLLDAVKQRLTGINILLYGEPGTGKTEFCKTLANKLGIKIYSLAEQDDYGGEPARHDRISSYRLAQNLLRRQSESLLLFDEMDDLFEDHFSPFQFGRRSGSSSKVFMNRLLENNPIPTIWTINDPSLLDETIIRRMSLAVEIKVPPPKILQRVWKRQLSKQNVTLPDQDLRRLAQSGASPAIVSSAVRFAKLSGGKADDCLFASQSIVKAIKGPLALPTTQPAAFERKLVVADCDLQGLAQKIVESGRKDFSFCLYGPPGTGKSAYVRYLADQLGVPVILKRGSDILSKYVGGSEQNIANAFSEAKENESFLIFDEADSLLGDRRHASKSWEISQVNEMLTWMEQHPLPFACTTNLIDSLDQAAIRRFTFKSHFDYLGHDEIGIAFNHFFGLTISQKEARRLKFATPGDFAVVKKKADYWGEGQSVAKLIELLHDEVAVKNENMKTAIGFQSA